MGASRKAVASFLVALSFCGTVFVPVRADQTLQVHTGLVRQGYGEMMSMTGIRGLACSASVSDFFTVNLAAVSLSQYPNACGKCLTLRCSDQVLCAASPESSVVVGIVDNCADCGVNTVVVGSFVASQLTGSALPNNGTIPVTWQFTDCSFAGQINVTKVAETPSPPPLAPPPVHSPVISVAPLLLLNSIVKSSVPAAEVVSSPLPTNLTSATNASETRVVEGGAVPVAEYAGSTSQTASTENYTQPAAEAQVVVPAVKSSSPVPAPSPEAEVQAVVASAFGTATPTIPAPVPEPERSMVLPVPAVPSSSPVPSPSPEAEVQAVVASTFGTTTLTIPAPVPEPERSMVLPVPATTSLPSSEPLTLLNPTTIENLPNSSDLAQTGRAYPAYYNPYPQDSFSSLACGFGRVSSYFQDHFAGISQSVWQQSTPACGSCIAVKCSNATECPNGKQVTVQITDSCGSCSNGDVNLSPLAFREVVGEAQQVVPVTWSVVPCRNYTEGTVYLWVGPGDAVYWRQVTFSNAAQPVIAASINGDRLQRGSDDRWFWQNNGHPLNQSMPMVVEIIGADGKKQSATLSSFNSQSLTIQL